MTHRTDCDKNNKNNINEINPLIPLALLLTLHLQLKPYRASPVGHAEDPMRDAEANKAQA
jgi:hypothetical protein